ncbi:hypothetical protein MRX96_052145 [Rhipicephalus microplus]
MSESKVASPPPLESSQAPVSPALLLQPADTARELTTNGTPITLSAPFTAAEDHDESREPSDPLPGQSDGTRQQETRPA